MVSYSSLNVLSVEVVAKIDEEEAKKAKSENANKWERARQLSMLRTRK